MSWGAFDLAVGSDLLLDSGHCDAFRSALRSLLAVSSEVLLVERNRWGAASRCVAAIRADGFHVEDRTNQESLAHVVVDGIHNPEWLSSEATEALVIRVRRGEKKQQFAALLWC